jgi:kynurenine formamidase
VAELDPAAVSQFPAEDTVLGYVEELSNWGRWGGDDERGTLNLITPANRRAAAATVRSGEVVSCSWEIDPTPHPDQTYGPPQRHMMITGQGHHDPDPSQSSEALGMGPSEYFGMVFHGGAETHLDALCHRIWNKQLYNGIPASAVTSRSGGTRLSVTGAGDGIVTRGVLLDVAAVRGVDWLESPDGAHPADLDEACRRAGVTVQPGDAVLLRTGASKRRHDLGRAVALQRGGGMSGWHADCLPWLREHDVAVIASDSAQEVMPNPYQRINVPVHTVGIHAMGLWLVDNCDLERLAAECARRQSWEFQFVVAPLKLIGGTGSPANVLAVL